jgi:mannosyltransferase
MANATKITKRRIGRRWRRLGLPVGILLLAYMLRVISLDAQSFWLDEFYAVWFIDRPFEETLRIIINPRNNGPLFFLLLWPWYRLAGTSDFAVRYASALSSVLTVGALWQLGKQWFDRRTANAAALFITLSPFAIWFGQEAKMYALHMLLATLSTLLLTLALQRKRWWLWAAYGVSINLLGYSHFFGAFAIAAQGIVALITARDGRRRRAYLLTMLLVALPYLPVIHFAMQIFPHLEITDPSKQFAPPLAGLREILISYSTRTEPEPLTNGVLVGVVILLVFGCAAAWRRCWRQGIRLVGLLILPIAFFYLVSFKLRVFAPKYLSATFPFFILILAVAVATLVRWKRTVGLVLLAVLLLGAGQAHLRDLTQPSVQRTDWRYAAAYLEEHTTEDDVIVTYVDYIDRLLKYYYTGDLPIRAYPYDPATPELLYDELEGEGYHALWLVLSHDRVYAPNHRLIEAARKRYPQITGQYPTRGQLQVLGFNMQWRHAALPDDIEPLTVDFGTGLALRGYQVDKKRLPPTEAVSHPPSNWIHVTTYWQRTGESCQPGQRPVAVLEDSAGAIWGRALDDRKPTVFDRDPPCDWPNDTLVEAHFDVNLNPATPAGSYQLTMILENAEKERAPQVPTAPLTKIKILPAR